MTRRPPGVIRRKYVTNAAGYQREMLENCEQLCYNNGRGLIGTNYQATVQPQGFLGQLATDRLILPISGPRRNVARRFFMSSLTLVRQGELFPENSEFHSKHLLKNRLAEKAAVAVDKRPQKRRPINDVTGRRYGKLVVVTITDEFYNGNPIFICRCDCGHEIKAVASHLERKKRPLNHCGCLGISRFKVPRPGSRGIGGYNSGGRHQTKGNPLVAFNGLLANYRNAAAKRGYAWELTDEQFLKLTHGNCHYCGTEPCQVYVNKPHQYTYNGVDRLDNNKPYAADNCVSCCGVCNRAKLERSADEFMVWIEQVYKHQHS